MHPCPFPLEIGATENQVGGLGLRAPGGPGRGETVLKEDLRKILKSCEGKIWGAQDPEEGLQGPRIPEEKVLGEGGHS